MWVIASVCRSHWPTAIELVPVSVTPARGGAAHVQQQRAAGRDRRVVEARRRPGASVPPCRLDVAVGSRVIVRLDNELTARVVALIQVQDGVREDRAADPVGLAERIHRVEAQHIEDEPARGLPGIVVARQTGTRAGETGRDVLAYPCLRAP